MLSSARCALQRLSSTASGLRMLATAAERPKIMRVGDFVEVRRTYTEEEMKTFADLSGDYNPLHTDKEFAKTTRFGRPIVFGVLMNGCAGQESEAG